MEKEAPKGVNPDIQEGQAQTPKRIDVYLGALKTQVDSYTGPLQEEEQKTLKEWKDLLQFTTALHDDLAGTGPRLDFLTTEARESYRAVLFQPAENFDLEEDDQDIAITLLLMGAQIQNEEYPTIARKSWERSIKRDFAHYGLSLTQAAEETGIDPTLLQKYDVGEIHRIDSGIFETLNEYLVGKEFLKMWKERGN